VIVPRWLLFLVAAWVIAFGVFRIVIALRRREPSGPNFMRKGLYARTPRSHVVFGGLYLLLGAVLIATALGWTLPMNLGACGGKGDSVAPPDSSPRAAGGDSASSK